MAESNEAAAGGAMNAEQIQKLVADSVTAAIRPVLDSMAQQQRALGAASVRDRFLSEKMKDLPELYRQRMPATDDLHALAAEEQRVREMYQRDFKAAGGKVPDVGGDNPGGSPPVAAIGGNAASPVENIAAGLKEKGRRAEAAR